MNLSELKDALSASAPDFSKYPDYEYRDGVKNITFDEPVDEMQQDAVKRFTRDMLLANLPSVVIFLVAVAVMYYLIKVDYNLDLHDSDPTAIIFLIGILSVFVIFVLAKPVILLVAKGKVAEGEIVCTKVVKRRTGKGVHTSYKAMVAQGKTKIIADNVNLTSKQYTKLTNGDKVYVVKKGLLSGAIATQD